MTARTPRWWRGVAALLVAAAALLGLTPTAVTQEDGGEGSPPVLLHQRTFVATGDAFELGIDPASVPADGSVEVVIRGRVLSRSELELTTTGAGLRSAVYQVARAAAELPRGDDGSLVVAISFDPDEPGGLNLRSAGVYPVEVRARDAEGDVVGTVVTHLVREPDEADESPPLAVALLARTLEEPSLRPDGERAVDEVALARTAAWLTPLAAGEVPVALAVSPDALLGVAERAAAGGEQAAVVLEQLRAIAATGDVLAGPFASTSPDALVDAGLDGELSRHLDAARRVAVEVLGRQPGDTWWAGDDLSEAGAEALAEVGVANVVVAEEQVEPLRAGLLSLSLAQPFLVPAGRTELDALAVDDVVLAHLGTDLSPALEANRLLTELAMLWFEQPGISRAAAVPLDEDVRPEVLAALVEALRDTDVLDPVVPGDAFDRAEPLVQPGGDRVDRELLPEDPAPIAAAVRRGIDDGRTQVTGMASLLGVGRAGADPDGEAARARVATGEAHLLLATSTALTRADQEAHLEAVATEVRSLVDAVSTPAHETVTLTARDGTVPMTVRNDGDVALHVVVHLSSTKLEFPDGQDVPLVLEPGSTRLDVPVRARASGSIPLEATITSPDGSLVLAELDYSIRSTAVAGVGVVLSAGAALFLLVWWARHWHRTRRSTKLVEARHPSARGPGH